MTVRRRRLAYRRSPARRHPAPGGDRASRLTEGEVRQAVRSTGAGGLESIAAVVLETDGSFSVITRAQKGSGSAQVDVEPTT